jgi:transposase
MDNVHFHKVTGITQVMQNAGHEVVFLPAYSPFFNPIENMFHQWKTNVRNRAPNTDTELMIAIRDIRCITAENCDAYVEHVYQNCVTCVSGERNFNYK